jgi:chromosomal replication initiation ATPase DnaA
MEYNNIVQCYKDQLQSLRMFHKELVRANLITDDIAIGSVPSTIMPHRLVELVEDVFDTSIQIKNRRQSVIFGRKAAAYILKKYTQLSLNEIAKHIGVGDHTTVIYNIKTAENLMFTEIWYKEKIDEIEKEIENFSKFVKE